MNALRAGAPMNVVEATGSYERWANSQVPLLLKELEYKHSQMDKAVFPFLRATFYRWVRLWAEVCPELAAAPGLLAVGDLHIENFGTWRDAEGRLSWGVNDFDEACYLPYTNDLVRLATSALFALTDASNPLSGDFKDACRAIQEGYVNGLVKPSPFILAEDHAWLRN